MFDLIKTILSLFPIFFVIYYFLRLKKREIVTWDLRNGSRCYSCKEQLLPLSNEEWKQIGDKENMKICKSCQRDETLNILIKNKNDKIYKFKKYLISKNSDKAFLVLLIVMMVFIILNVCVDLIFKISFISIISSLVQSFFWSLLVYRLKLTSIKKPSVKKGF